MSEAQRATETINISDVRQQIAAVLNSVFRNERRVLVEKSGIPVAAVVSVEDLRRLERFEKRETRAADETEHDPEPSDSDGRGKKKKHRSKSK